MIRLERLGPEHAEAILAGQDHRLAEEIVGQRWTRESLDAFLARAARWRSDGPVREFAAVDGGEAAGPTGSGTLLGGGGLHLVDPGLERGQAAMTYWLLGRHRGRGHGHALAATLVEHARADARIRELVLRIAPTNHPSRALARGLGARPTGEVERHPADAERTVDRWVLALRER
ncbi:MAG TPA: GNAT family protein [Brachybacterium sp.]|nr:GNAT family protein [Brachybacterium sp.]